MRLAGQDAGATTIGKALASSVARLRAAGVPEPEADASVTRTSFIVPSRPRSIANPVIVPSTV